MPSSSKRPVPATPLALHLDPFSSRPARQSYPHKCKWSQTQWDFCTVTTGSQPPRMRHRPWGRIAAWLPRVSWARWPPSWPPQPRHKWDRARTRLTGVDRQRDRGRSLSSRLAVHDRRKRHSKQRLVVGGSAGLRASIRYPAVIGSDNRIQLLALIATSSARTLRLKRRTKTNQDSLCLVVTVGDDG